jgi:hypothetical protein
MEEIKLPEYLIPQKKTNLVRCGSKFDGGYLINKNVISKCDTLITLGIHENWDFEKEIFQKYNIKKIILFDPETSNFLIFKYLVKAILFLNAKKIILYIKKFKELKFLKSEFIFIKKKFNKDLVADFIKSQNILLKIDIEGDEYKDLEFILKNQNNINCLVIEFHNINQNLNQIKNFISKFKLKLVHTHVNTFSKKHEVAIELTFSKNVKTTHDKWDQFIFSEIDSPNHPSHKIIKIR